MSHQQPYGYPALPAQTQILVRPYRCSTAHVVIAWICAAITLTYLLPWAIAASRNRRNVGSIALINLFLGWSLAGWIVALVMACGTDQPLVVVQHTYAAPPSQPWAQTPPQQLQPWARTPPQQPALPPAPVYRPYPVEPTMVDPLGNEPTQTLLRSPWEPDHRR